MLFFAMHNYQKFLNTSLFIKALLKQCLPCLPECLFIQQLFILFLRTIILFWCSKVHRLTLILPTKYPKVYRVYEVSMQIRSFEGKNGSLCIFTLSGTLSISKIFINVIRRLPGLKVLNFQSSGFLKALQHAESPNYFQIWLVIKFWSWYYSITLRLSLRYFWTFWSLCTPYRESSE